MAKHSGARCWRLAGHGMPVCTSHGARRRDTVRAGSAHWNYQGKSETRVDRAERSRRLDELRQIEAAMFMLDLAAPGAKRWSGRKPKSSI
jgi:hypothetical protein